MTLRAGRATTVLAATTIALAGCESGGGGGESSPRSDGRGGQETVTVTRDSMDVVTTVPATVGAGARVEITSPGPGTVERISNRGVTFRLDTARDSGGKQRDVTLDFPKGMTLTDELVDKKQRVPANYPVAKGEIEGFAMVAALDRQSLYKVYSPPLSARAQVNEGPGPFDCPLANTVPSSSHQRGADAAELGEDESEDGPDTTESGMQLVCVVPPDVNVFAGMSGVMAIKTASVKDALLLPVEGVAGNSSRGEVTVVRPDGSGTEDRTVRLGATDGSQVEVVSGVREGEKVRVPAPNLAGTSDVDGEEG